MNDEFKNDLLSKISELIDDKLNKFYEKISNNFSKIDKIENEIKSLKEQLLISNPIKKVTENKIKEEEIEEKKELKELKVKKENNKNYSCKFDNTENKKILKLKKKDLIKNDIIFSFKVINNGDISWPENCYLISNNEEIFFEKTLINEGKAVEPNQNILIKTLIKLKNIKEGKFNCFSNIVDSNNNKIGNDKGFLYLEIERDNESEEKNIELNEEKIKELEKKLDENLNTSSIFSIEEIRNAILQSKGDLETASKILFPD